MARQLSSHDVAKLFIIGMALLGAMSVGVIVPVFTLAADGGPVLPGVTAAAGQPSALPGMRPVRTGPAATVVRGQSVAAVEFTDRPPPTRTALRPATLAPSPVPTATPPASALSVASPSHTLPPAPSSTTTPSPTPTRTPGRTSSPPPTHTEPPLPAGMVRIPAGFFTMGSAGGAADEQPEHPVLLSAFFLDRHEVTNQQYQACVAAGDCTPPHSLASFTRPRYFADAEYAEYPVVNVDWSQAQAYCQALGKRLPTEAEWEYAASGPEDNVWPWGNHFEPVRVAVAAGDTQGVDNYPLGHSPFGVLNLAGNAAEWVADSYSATYYASAPASNPRANLPNAHRIYRGGSFGNPDATLYTTSRRYHKPAGFYDVDIGFRCAQPLAGPSSAGLIPDPLKTEFCALYLAYKPSGVCP